MTLLCADYINAVPKPVRAVLCGHKDQWHVLDVDVETGCFRIDVCGLPEVHAIGEVLMFIDGTGKELSPDSFFC